MTQPYKRPTDDLAPLIGKATIAWNDIQFAILSIFFTILPCSRELSETIFFSHKSDRAQRDMVIAVVKSEIVPMDKDLADKIIAKIKEVDKEAAVRNAAVHSMWMLDLPSQELSIYQNNALAKKGSEAEVRAELEQLSERFNQLAISLFEYR